MRAEAITDVIEPARRRRQGLSARRSGVDSRGRPGGHRPPQRHAGGRGRAGVRRHDGANVLPFVGPDGHRRDLARCSSSRIAFLGGAVSYSRGQFIAITVLVDRAPAGVAGVFVAIVEWVVIVVVAADRRLFDSAADRQRRGEDDPARHQLCVDDGADHARLADAVRAHAGFSLLRRSWPRDRRRHRRSSGVSLAAVPGSPSRTRRRSRALYCCSRVLFLAPGRGRRRRSASCSRPSASSACRRSARPT